MATIYNILEFFMEAIEHNNMETITLALLTINTYIQNSNGSVHNFA